MNQRFHLHPLMPMMPEERKRQTVTAVMVETYVFGTYLIPTAMILMVMGCDPSDDVNAFLVSYSLYLFYIKDVDYCCFLGRFIDEEVRIVICANENGYDLHSGERCR